MTVTLIGAKHYFIGTNAERVAMSVTGQSAGSEFFEHDTGDNFILDAPGGTWRAYPITSALVAAIKAKTDLIGASVALETGGELAKVPKSDATVTWNATAAAQITTQAALALTNILLNKLTALADGTGVYPASVIEDSTLAKILSKADPAVTTSFNNTTDSLEALADAIAVVAGYLDTEIAAILAAVDTEVAAIKNVTDAEGVLEELGGSLLLTAAEQNLVINDTPEGVSTPKVIKVNLTPMGAAAVVVLKVYARIKSGGGLVQVSTNATWTFTGAQTNPACIEIPLTENRFGYKVTATQSTEGAGYVTLDWELFREV